MNKKLIILIFLFILMGLVIYFKSLKNKMIFDLFFESHKHDFTLRQLRNLQGLNLHLENHDLINISTGKRLNNLYIKEKPLVIVIYSTSCSSCVVSDILVQLNDVYKSKNINIIGIGSAVSALELKKFNLGLNISFPSFFDIDDKFKKSYDLPIFTDSRLIALLIDLKGKVIFSTFIPAKFGQYYKDTINELVSKFNNLTESS